MPADTPSRASLIPTWLAISWWWLLLGVLAESLLHYLIGFAAISVVLTAWSFAQAIWLRSVMQQSRAIYWYAATFLLGLLSHLPWDVLIHRSSTAWAVFLILYAVTMFVLEVAKIFILRDELVSYFQQDEENAYFTLSGVMTFFFSTFYFQYWLHDLAQRAREDRRDAMFTSAPIP